MFVRSCPTRPASSCAITCTGVRSVQWQGSTRATATPITRLGLMLLQNISVIRTAVTTDKDIRQDSDRINLKTNKLFVGIEKHKITKQDVQKCFPED